MISDDLDQQKAFESNLAFNHDPLVNRYHTSFKSTHASQGKMDVNVAVTMLSSQGAVDLLVGGGGCG